MTRELSLKLALLPVLTMLVLLLLGARFMAVGPALLVPVMLAAAALAGWLARRRGHDFAEIQRVTGEKLAAVLPMLLILLAIGMLIGSWMLSGTIPMMVYYGLRLVNPGYLLLTAFLVTCVMSLSTGTSWGSAGTIGVALMGLAQVVGVSPAACAGAVLSGAYFGDKMSPLSDTTNISAIGAGADLYAHIRHMLYTAVPSFVLAAIVYTWAGLGYRPPSGGQDSVTGLLGAIEASFHLSWWTLLPPLIVVAGILRKVPPVLAMTASSLAALAVGILLHGFTLEDALSSAVTGFRVEMTAASGLDPATLGGDFARLVERGGIYSMVGNFVMIIAAFLLAAGLEVSGALDKLVRSMLAAARGTFGLILATMTAGATMIGLTSHGGVTALVVGNLFQGAFAEQGLAPVNLSRSLEDSVTITEPLMPWTVSAVFMATTLGVPTTDYLPWAVFCYSGSFFSLLLAFFYDRTGFGLVRSAENTER